MDVSASRTYPAAPEAAFDACLSVPLPFFLGRRFAALPPIKEVRDQHSWAAPGDTRTVVMSDGSTTRETLTAVARPTQFTYLLDELTGPLKALATSVRGRFDVEPAGTGSRITWSWSIDPRSPLGPIAMPVLGWMWRGWARQGLARLEQLLVP